MSHIITKNDFLVFLSKKLKKWQITFFIFAEFSLVKKCEKCNKIMILRLKKSTNMQFSIEDKMKTHIQYIILDCSFKKSIFFLEYSRIFDFFLINFVTYQNLTKIWYKNLRSTKIWYKIWYVTKFIKKKSNILEYSEKKIDFLKEQSRIMYWMYVLILSSIENYIFVDIFKRKIIILIHFSYFFTKPNSAKMKNVICHFFHFFWQKN